MDFKKLVTRIKNLLFKPQMEWGTIESEPVYESQEVVRDYALPVIFAVVFWELVLVGIRLKMVYFSIINFTLLMLTLFLTTSLVYELAPRFGSFADRNQAAKLTAYATTPIWLAQMIQADIEWLFFVKPIGVTFTSYLYVIGIPIIMKPTPQAQLPYTLVVVGVVIALNTLIWILLEATRQFLLH